MTPLICHLYSKTVAFNPFATVFFYAPKGGGLLFFGGQRKVTKESPLRVNYLLYRYAKFNKTFKNSLRSDI